MEKIKSMLKGDSKDNTEDTSSNRNVREMAGRDTDERKTTSDRTGGGVSSRTGGLDERVDDTTTTAESYETNEQRMAPAVQHERIARTQEEQVQQVVDQERHKDHYHTTVQPLTDRQVDPTRHVQQTAETQYGEFEHDDAAKTKAALEAQAAQFKSTRTDAGTTATRTDLGTVGTESVHHHMHETVQPVIEKEIIQPSVVHTTVPIKEVHHEASHIHGTSTAPPMTINEFEKVSNVEGSQK